MSVEYHRFEDYSALPDLDMHVVCSFKTDRHGYLQVGHTGDKLIEYDNEPSLYNYPERDREYIENMMLSIYWAVFNSGITHIKKLK